MNRELRISAVNRVNGVIDSYVLVGKVRVYRCLASASADHCRHSDLVPIGYNIGSNRRWQDDNNQRYQVELKRNFVHIVFHGFSPFFKYLKNVAFIWQRD